MQQVSVKKPSKAILNVEETQLATQEGKLSSFEIINLMGLTVMIVFEL